MNVITRQGRNVSRVEPNTDLGIDRVVLDREFEAKVGLAAQRRMPMDDRPAL